jgi:SAM-dependent methyltransferase
MTIDEMLGQKYGDYAGFTTDASPAIVEHFGEDPLNEIKRLLKLYIRPDSRILDIGCGAGQTLCQFAPFVKEAWGIDPARDLLVSAHQRVLEQRLTNVTLIEGNSGESKDVSQLPDRYFDIAFTESGPGINAQLIEKLSEDAYFLQEVGGRYSAYHLQEILGRVPYTNYANHYWDQTHLIHAADLGLLPVSFKHYFWEVYFRDLDHLEAYVGKEAVLSNWRLAPRPYQPERDWPALELYARYNTTAKGIRLLYHIQVLVWRRALIHYYPVDGTPA